MKRFIIPACDGCEKDLSSEKFYHIIEQKYEVRFKDPNTEEEEEMQNMLRATNASYCHDCFLNLVDKLDEFLTEVSPQGHEPELKIEYTKEAKENQTDEDDAGAEVKGRA